MVSRLQFSKVCQNQSFQHFFTHPSNKAPTPTKLLSAPNQYLARWLQVLSIEAEAGGTSICGAVEDPVPGTEKQMLIC